MQSLAAEWRRAGAVIGFVPTMGCLHDGHMSLVRQARSKAERVVLSIYVNPAQFGPGEDYERYPRTFSKDKRLCLEAGVDVVFAPENSSMYAPNPPHSTRVLEKRLSSLMEGAVRPGHFEGVATVVAKLFNIVTPDFAVFGAKDFQQCAVIQRMVRDLNFPVKVVVGPTVRERDGLALSSRNQYLSNEERKQAVVVFEALQAARAMSRRGRTTPAELKRGVKRVISKASLARLDYVEIFDPNTLEPVRGAVKGAHMALAVFFGRTRLIDNMAL